MKIATMMNETNGTRAHSTVEDTEGSLLIPIITRVAGEPEDVAITQDMLPTRDQTLDLQVLLDQKSQTVDHTRMIGVSIRVEMVVSDLLFVSLRTQELLLCRKRKYFR
jgi:hypothetical protein